MTTLVTGGTGQTGSVVARLLHNANQEVLIASRSGTAPSPFKAVPFDWFNPATFSNPFEADPRIDKVYYVGPPAVDHLSVVKPFIDLAISRGVKRFVILGSTISEPGTLGALGTDKVYAYIAGKGVDFTLLRPTWFIENFQTTFLHSILHQNTIITATGDGKVPFVAVDDIADVAFEALTADTSPNTDYYILGPDLLSYDEAANIFSQLLGRKITHRSSADERLAIFETLRIPQNVADGLLKLDLCIADGTEVAVFTSPKARIGKRHLRAYIETNNALWLNNVEQ